MHVAIPVLPPQKEQTELLLERIADLGGVSQFPALIVSAGEINLAPLHKLASSAFQSVSLLPIEIPDGHPAPASVLFARTAFHLGEVIGDSYLYLEPDSWPTSTHWLKDLVSAYREHNARFMGKLVPLPPPDLTGESYMLATGIYPKDFYAKSDLIRQVPLDKPAPEFLQGEIVYRGKAHDSGLFALYGEDFRNAGLVLTWKPLPPSVEPEAKFAPGGALDSLGIDRDATNALRFMAEGPEESPARPAGILQDGQLVAIQSLRPGEFPQAFEPAKESLRAYQASVGAVSNSIDRGRPWPEVARDGSSASATFEADAKLAADTVAPDASWTHNPQAFDPSIEVPIPATALAPEAEIPAEMLKPGTLATYPQPDPIVSTVTEGGITRVVAPDSIVPAEGFASEAERNTAIKKAQAVGMPWREMLSTFKLAPKVLKSVLNAV